MIWVGYMGENREVFVLYVRKLVKIVGFAEEIIRISGYTPGKDIEIACVGIGHRTKLYEEILHWKRPSLMRRCSLWDRLHREHLQKHKLGEDRREAGGATSGVAIKMAAR